MATARRLPSGSWRVQLYIGRTPDNRRRYLSFTANTEKEVEYQALQYQLRYKEVNQDPTSATLDETMEKYISSEDGILSPSTIRGYEDTRRNNLKDLISLTPNRVTQPVVQEAVNQGTKPYTDRRSKQRVRSAKSLRNIHGLLSVALAEYHPSLTLRTRLPQKEVKEQRILEPEQMAALLRAVEGDMMELPVLMGLWLCMRAFEISGLTWSCVDFRRKTTTIRRTLVRDKDNHWVEKGIKTASSARTLSVPDYIMEKLAAAKETSNRGDRVVPLSSENVYKRLKTILHKHNLPNVWFHGLRHTTASVMLTPNIPDEYAQIRGGWATNHTVKTVYQHTM